MPKCLHVLVSGKWIHDKCHSFISKHALQTNSLMVNDAIFITFQQILVSVFFSVPRFGYGFDFPFLPSKLKTKLIMKSSLPELHALGNSKIRQTFISELYEESEH